MHIVDSLRETRNALVIDPQSPSGIQDAMRNTRTVLATVSNACYVVRNAFDGGDSLYRLLSARIDAAREDEERLRLWEDGAFYLNDIGQDLLADVARVLSDAVLSVIESWIMQLS